MTAASGPEAVVTSEPQSQLRRCCWCLFYVAGIIGTLATYGLLQERIMSQPYSGGEFFRVSLFLVFINRIVAIAFTLVMISIRGEAFGLGAPWWKYLAISFSLVGASTCQYDALKYVSFPVQMLGKSFKMMPVMIWSMMISQKRYGLTDWLVALMVTVGVVQFLMFGPISSPTNRGNSMYGLLLLLCFLPLDGFTSTFQEKLHCSLMTCGSSCPQAGIQRVLWR